MRIIKKITTAKKMCLILAMCLVATVMIASLRPTIAANDDEPIQLTATNVRVTSFNSVTVDILENSRTGAIETLRKEGHVIVLVETDIKATWTKKTTKTTSVRNFVLVGKDGKSLPVIGTLRNDKFNDGLTMVYFRQSANWPDENPTTPLNAVFLVGVDAGPFTLKSDHGLSAPITLPTKTANPPHIANKMNVKVKSAKLIDTLKSNNFTVGHSKTSTEFVNPGGVFLEVTFDLTPNDSNGSFGDKLYWHTDWFGVRCNGKFHSHTVGETWMKGIGRNVSHNTDISNGKASTETATFYFPVTSDTKTFELLCLMQPVAKAKVEPN